MAGPSTTRARPSAGPGLLGSSFPGKCDLSLESSSWQLFTCPPQQPDSYVWVWCHQALAVGSRLKAVCLPAPGLCNDLLSRPSYAPHPKVGAVPLYFYVFSIIAPWCFIFSIICQCLLVMEQLEGMSTKKKTKIVRSPNSEAGAAGVFCIRGEIKPEQSYWSHIAQGSGPSFH